MNTFYLNFKLVFAQNTKFINPKSLLNMFKELEKDENVEFTRPNHGDLTSWADQGVVLLNACLTVTAANANSDKDKGEEQLL